MREILSAFTQVAIVRAFASREVLQNRRHMSKYGRRHCIAVHNMILELMYSRLGIRTDCGKPALATVY